MVVVVPDSNNAHAKKCPYHHHRTTRAKNAEDNDITITNNDGSVVTFSRNANVDATAAEQAINWANIFNNETGINGNWSVNQWVKKAILLFKPKLLIFTV